MAEIATYVRNEAKFLLLYCCCQIWAMGLSNMVMQHAVPLTVTASTKAFCKQQLPFVSHHNNVQRVTYQYDATRFIIFNSNLIITL